MLENRKPRETPVVPGSGVLYNMPSICGDMGDMTGNFTPLLLSYYV